MNKITVSIIVPIDGEERYLEECLESLVHQSLSNYEVIVVRDNQNTNHEKIINQYVKKYPKIVKSFVQDSDIENDIRNFGVEKAQGEYIGFVNSNDYVDTEMFDLLYQKANQQNSDIVFCDFYKNDSFTLSLKHVVMEGEEYDCSIEENPDILLSSQDYVWNKIYRKSFWIENDFQFSSERCEDVSLSYQVLLCAKKISAVAKGLYICRVPEEDSSNNINKTAMNVFLSTKNILDFYPSHTKNTKVLLCMEKVCYSQILMTMEQVVDNGTIGTRIRFYHQFCKFVKKNLPNIRKNKWGMRLIKKRFYTRLLYHPILMYFYLIFQRLIKKMVRFIKESILHHSPKTNEQYYVSHERLRELQLLELDILKEVDRICQKNHITYYLSKGTLLGAIRHQGFIPWDNDIDIAMPREDYEKFLSIVSDQLKKEYVLLNEQSSNRYYFPFSKIVLVDNHGFINKGDKFDEQYSGPFMDIFPIDYFHTDDSKEWNKTCKKIQKIQKSLYLKCDVVKAKSWKERIQKWKSHFVSTHHYHRQLKKLMTKYSSDADYMVNLASSYQPSRQIVKKEIYGKPRYVEFEDGKFPIPSQAEELLKKIYGDYEQLPLVARQNSRHSFYDEQSVRTMYLTKIEEDKEFEHKMLQEIRELQLYELQILKEVDKACREHHITYYLGEGSMLGAIRHQGFIPWDDDVDILMPRDDLERFLKNAKDILPKNLEVQSIQNIKGYWVLSPKIRLLDKTKFKQEMFSKYTKNLGPYIDVFPLDYTSNSLKQLDKQYRQLKFYRRLLFVKQRVTKRVKLSDLTLKFYSYFISVEKIHKKVKKIEMRYHHDERKYMTNFGSYYHVRKETFPAELFGKPRYVKFEDFEAPVPQEAEYMLKTIYGDYMKLPPENKRKGKHDF